MEHSDCGATCVRIVARYFGKDIAPAYLRSLCDSNRLGVSVKDVAGMFSSIHCDNVVLKIGLDKADEMPLPAVLYWDECHFVVLYRVRKGRYYIVDPARGKMKVSEERMRDLWLDDSGKGICILAEPTDSFNEDKFPRPDTHHRLSTLAAKAFSGNRCAFSMSIILTVLMLCAEIAVPFMFQTTVDRGIADKDIGLIWILVAGQFAIFIGNFVSGTIVEFIMTRLGLDMSINMLSEYLTKLVRLPLSFFERKTPSDLIRKTEDQNRIKNFLVSFPGSMFLTSITLLVFSGLLIWLSPLIFLLVVFFTGIGMIWNVSFLRKRREIDYSYFSASSENANNLYELVYGMPEIRANNAQNIRVAVWEKVQRKINRLSLEGLRLKIVMDGGADIVNRIRDVMVLGICASLVVTGEMSIGLMMTISYIEGRIAGPFTSLVNSFKTVQDASMSMDRVEEIMREEEVCNENSKPPADCSVELRDVWFKYAGSTSPFVLKGISTEIPQGKVTAVVGESGSGKSTLAKILLGLYEPFAGSLMRGGIDSATADMEQWMKRCAVVMQEGMVYSGSIISNIALSDEKPDKERCHLALKTACLDDFVNSLPMGLDTRLGNTGISLSGGQKQRLLIARAIYRNPEMLVLDEATSSLDAATEARVMENIYDFSKGKTVVVVAHRLSTIRNADKIIFIKDGQCSESGSHDELIGMRSDYYTLVEHQL